MGILNLLPLLKSITEDQHVEIYRGKKVAIDAYAWLHKACYSCAIELCTGVPTERYLISANVIIKYIPLFFHLLKLFWSFGIYNQIK